MSKTISINAGSSSLKWQLYQMPEEKVLAKGLLERIGLKDSISTVKFDGRSEKQVLDIEDHTQAVKILLDDLKRFNIIESYDVQVGTTLHKEGVPDYLGRITSTSACGRGIT